MTRVAGRSSGNIQTLEDGNAARDQRAKRSRESCHRDFAKQDANQRQFEQSAIDGHASDRRPIPDF